MKGASDRSPQEPGAPEPRARQAGFTLVEAVVAVAIMGLLLLGLMTLYGTSWKSQTQAYQDYRLQNIARTALNAICQGDKRSGYAGLVLGSTVVVQSTPTQALAYRVGWTDSEGVARDDDVTYYVSAGKLYRVVTAHEDPLSVTTSGGDEVATNVADFTVTTETNSEGIVSVVITLTIQASSGRQFVARTQITPRAQTQGPPAGE